MTFLDPPYGLFLLLVLGLYWGIGYLPQFKKKTDENDSKTTINSALISARLWILLFASLLFYSLLQIVYIPLLLAIAYLNFYFANAMETRAKGSAKTQYAQLSNQDWEQVQRVWNQRTTKLLSLGITLNVLLLLGFKYIPFLLNTFAALFNWSIARQSAIWVDDRLSAPLGVSFFTFECIAYLIDVYRGAPATRNFLEFTSYKLFFPKLIAGPISRYHHFAAQLKEQQFLQWTQASEGLWLITCGAVKKALIADRLGIFVDLSLGNLERAGSGDLWLAIFTYGLQLYFDFSGYVDIARGSALLLGFSLPQNFDAPYFTTSIAAFWRRWHMTLGDWLRNYLYFPLGGSRKGLARTCFNLFLVMLIAGVWHGAAWGYILWGILHGIALALHRLTDTLSKQVVALAAFWQSLPGTLCAWILTQGMVFFSWIFFRLPNLTEASLALRHFWNYSGDIQFAQKVYGEALQIERFHFILAIGAIALLMSLVYFFQRGLKLQLNRSVKLVLVPVSLFIVWILAPEGGLQYIYFDF
ncbi:MBOAT family O-acyltransferase [Lusitaniella coriacea]|uniref:MBOAT family O-acyltransferase n=1 Tax=Lusitaniella coriacea TaxID=1983105 RepID=UPI003CF382E5